MLNKKIISKISVYVLSIAMIFMALAFVPASANALTGLALTIRQIVDDSNVIIRIDPTDSYGAELANFTVENSSGDVQTLTSVASAFVELGGDENALSTFKLTFAAPLAPDTYTITLTNAFDLEDGLYDPASVDFTIEPDLLDGLELTLRQIVDDSNVIIRIDPTDSYGAELANFTVENSSGDVQTLTSVASAFVELGGDENALSTFKLTFAAPLAPDTYTITLTNAFDLEDGLYAPATLDFTIEGEEEDPDLIDGLEITLRQIVDDSHVIIRIDPLDAYGVDLVNVIVENSSGEAQTVTAFASAFVELGGDENALGTFKLTFASALVPDTYTITLSNFWDDASGDVYAPATLDFTIEDEEEDPEEEPNPQTGDAMPYAILLAAAALGISLIGHRKTSKKNG